MDQDEYEIFEEEMVINDICDIRGTLIEKESILYVNIRSINKNFNKLEIILQKMSIKPLAIVCAESWNVEVLEYYNLNGYNIYYNDSKINKADGVVLYVNNSVSENTVVKVYGKLRILHSNIQVRNNHNIQISAMYRSHDILETDFLMNYKSFLDEHRNVKNHMIVGDFNIDTLSIGIINQEFFSSNLEHGYKPCFRGVTRPSNNKNLGSCIDNFFIKLLAIEHKAFKWFHDITDHYPLIVSLGLNIDNEKENENYSFINYDKLRKTAEDTNWNQFLLLDPNLSTDLIIDGIKNCINKSTTFRKTRKKMLKNIPRKKWITEAIITSCNTKQQLFRLWKLDPQNLQLKNEYKKYTKILDRVIVDAKYKYDEKIINQNIHDPKLLWTIINNRIGKNAKKKTDIESLINDKNEKLVNKDHMVEYINKYYCTIGKKLRDKIEKRTNEPLTLPEMRDSTIFFNFTNVKEITRIVQKMKIKSSGVDNTNIKVIKNIIEYIAEPLSSTYNRCIELGVWPDALKKAEIVPIHKAKDKNKVENYRPISLISNIAKIFEKLTYSRIYNFIYKNNIISKQQYGFLRNIGTKDALQRLTNTLNHNLDKNIKSIVTFLDLQKAFDTVDRNILLQKLYRYGIRGTALALMTSYLTGRKQRVKLNNVYSNYRDIDIGVPQGTILGPLLFILYVNDLLENMPDESILSFADDTAVITSDSEWDRAINNMNKLLEKVANWLVDNKLSLNIQKTVYITFGSYYNSVPENVEIRIYDRILERVQSYKYLGVIIDFNMKWSYHINYIVNKTKYLIFLFHKLSKIMSSKTMIMVYYALFHGVMNYGIIAWGSACTTTLSPLQNLQNKLLRIISKKNQCLIAKHPLRLDQAFILESVLFHYHEFSTKFTTSKSLTRNKSLQMPKLNKTIYKNSSYITALRTYNSMPNDLKSLNTRTQNIKNKIKGWLEKEI